MAEQTDECRICGGRLYFDRRAGGETICYACEQKARGAGPAAEIQGLLLWARANRFAVREVQVGEVRLVVDDLGHAPAVQTRSEPKSVHGAWAEVLGVPSPDDLDDDDEAEGGT